MLLRSSKGGTGAYVRVDSNEADRQSLAKELLLDNDSFGDDIVHFLLGTAVVEMIEELIVSVYAGLHRVSKRQ